MALQGGAEPDPGACWSPRERCLSLRGDRFCSKGNEKEHRNHFFGGSSRSGFRTCSRTQLQPWLLCSEPTGPTGLVFDTRPNGGVEKRTCANCRVFCLRVCVCVFYARQVEAPKHCEQRAKSKLGTQVKATLSQPNL